MVDVLAPTGLIIRPLLHEEISNLARNVEEMSEAQFTNRWREYVLGYRELLVAELDGQLVGTISLFETQQLVDSIHLFALEVGPRWRNRGIGTALVRYVLDEAQRRGRRRVFLEVRCDNPARRLYQRLGFRRVGPAFLNVWMRFGDEGSAERIEEMSYRMVKRIQPRR